MDDFRALLAAAHARGLRVLLDLVMNHTSDQHPWFRESAASRENPKRDWNLKFHPTDNDQLLCYSKEEGDNLILVAVNLDPRNTQSGWLDFDRAPGESYGLEDLVAAGHYTWSGRRNFVQLNPHTLPAHVFRVTRK